MERQSMNGKGGMSRRRAMVSIAAGAGATGLSGAAVAQEAGRTYVLVHNGFAGGWVWADVAADLRSAGHTVHAPTLTGLGERAHLATPEVDLDTHVQDIVGVFDCEEISDVILVGSSSSAMVIAGVAERIPEKIGRLVYVDTIEPKDGQSWVDLMTPAVSAPLLEVAEKFGEGWRVPRNDVPPPRWVAHPLKTVTQPLKVSNPDAAQLPRSYVHATAKPEGWFFGLGEVIDAYAAEVRASGADFHEIDSDHLPQLSKPREFAAILTTISG
jgi:pimeloyl-ACP methyl ester carboxylesterase